TFFRKLAAHSMYCYLSINKKELATKVWFFRLILNVRIDDLGKVKAVGGDRRTRDAAVFAGDHGVNVIDRFFVSSDFQQRPHDRANHIAEKPVGRNVEDESPVGRPLPFSVHERTVERA